jgi:hypothetical protein
MAHRHVEGGQNGHSGRVLRNAILGFVATAIWTMNYVVYFARDIRAWHQRERRGAPARRPSPERSVTGPLAANERRTFPPPPPPPPPVRDAEVIPFPEPRRARRK